MSLKFLDLFFFFSGPNKKEKKKNAAVVLKQISYVMLLVARLM